jgi:aerobic-type carbon monoxide dehydrogenase small subunit (CoxS/CutS family)
MPRRMNGSVTFRLNGESVTVQTDPSRLLLWVLRTDLGLTGTKYGCGMGLCGACTVLLGNDAVRSCTITLADAANQEITTIEGLAHGDQLHPLQQAFIEKGAFQCGYCTPGMILNAQSLLRRQPVPSETEVLRGMEGHLCRCGAHQRIVKAILQAATAMQGGAP